MTTQQIKQFVEGDYKINNSQAFYNELGRVMRSRGVEKHKLPPSQGAKRGWKGIKYVG